MKKRIYSLLVTLVLAVSVILGVSILASADNTDGIKNTAISLAENVTLKIDVAIAEPTEDAYAKITLPGGDVDTTQLVAAAPKNGDNYVFTAEVAIKDLEKVVKIEICNADGTTLVAPDVVSAIEYCETYLEKYPSGEYADLVYALAAYGYAADIYFDEDAEADGDADADFSAVADVKTAGTLPAGITHRSATLLLESETTIRHYFELAEGKSIGAYTFFVDLDKDGKVDLGEKLTASSKVTEDGDTVYYVEIADLTPNQLDEIYTVAVTDGTDTYTADYGVVTYAKRAYANGDAKAKNLAAALFAYSTEAGKLTGTITFDADGGDAIAAQAYEYGVAYPITVAPTKENHGFIGWVDADGNFVDTISATQTGDVTLTAKWAYVMASQFDYSKSTYHGTCDKHTADNSENGICKTCGWCTTDCEAVMETVCSKCEKNKAGAAIAGVLNPSYQAKYNDNPTGYSVPMTVGGKEGIHINYTELKNTQYQLNGGGGSFAQVYNAGGRFVSIAFDAMRMDEDDNVPVIYIRNRSSSATDKKEVGLIDFNVESTQGIRILGAASGVKIDTTAHRYEFLFDMTYCNPTSAATKGYIIGHILVDGVIKFSTTYNIDSAGKEYIQNWTNDGYGSFRFQSGGGTMWISDIYAGPTSNVIAYKNAGVPADAPYTYTTGVKTDLPSPVLEEGQSFLGWYADPAYKQQINAVPANASGLFTAYARIESITPTASFDYSAMTEYVSGYCPNHTDGDNNALCDNCGYCIGTCNSSDGKSGKCTVCNNDLIGDTQLGLINSKDVRNNFYTDNVVKKDANGNDVAGTVYGVSNAYGSNVSFGTFAGGHYATNASNGVSALYYEFVMARAYEEGNVTSFSTRIRGSAEYWFMWIDSEGVIFIGGESTGVKLDMVARTYRIVIDITDGENQIFNVSIYVDGELEYEDTIETNAKVSGYTRDELGQCRLAGAGAIWIAKIEVGRMVY